MGFLLRLKTKHSIQVLPRLLGLGTGTESAEIATLDYPLGHKATNGQ